MYKRQVLRRGHGQDERIHTLLDTVGADPATVFGAADDLPTEPVVAEPDEAFAEARSESLQWLEDSLAVAVRAR